MKQSEKFPGQNPGIKTDVKATLDELEFLEALVEDLADRGYGLGYDEQPVPTGSLAIETSSLEAYVSGKVFLPGTGNPPIDMSFTTCFLFTCITTQKDIFKLTWSNSLS